MKESKEKLGVGWRLGPHFPGEVCPATQGLLKINSFIFKWFLKEHIYMGDMFSKETVSYIPIFWDFVLESSDLKSVSMYSDWGTSEQSSAGKYKRKELILSECFPNIMKIYINHTWVNLDKYFSREFRRKKGENPII